MDEEYLAEKEKAYLICLEVNNRYRKEKTRMVSELDDCKTESNTIITNLKDQLYRRDELVVLFYGWITS